MGIVRRRARAAAAVGALPLHKQSGRQPPARASDLRKLRKCECSTHACVLNLTLRALPRPGVLVEWSNELRQAQWVAPDRLNLVKRCLSPSCSTPLRSVPSSQLFEICPHLPPTEFTIANRPTQSMSQREKVLAGDCSRRATARHDASGRRCMFLRKRFQRTEHTASSPQHTVWTTSR